jgi:uncharacterized membrane protein
MSTPPLSPAPTPEPPSDLTPPAYAISPLRPPGQDDPPHYSPPAHWGPFTAGDLLRRTFEIYRRHAGLFIGIASVAAALNFLLSVPSAAFSHLMRPHGHDMRAALLFPLMSLAVAMVSSAVSLLVYSFAQGALFLGVHGVRMGSAPSVGSALEATSPRIGSLLAGAILVLLRVVGWTMLVAIPAFILAIIPVVAVTVSMSRAGAGGPNPASMATIGVLAILIGGILGVGIMIFAYWIYSRYVLFVPVIMEEELSGSASIRRSIQLSKGSRGRIYALLGILLLLGLIPTPAVFMLAFSAVRHPGVHGLALLLLGQLIAAIFTGLLTIPIGGIGTALCYYDLRARHANAAVMAPPPPPPPPPALYPGIPASAVPPSAGPTELNLQELTYDVETPMPPAAQAAPIPPPPAVGEPNTGIAPTEPEPPHSEEIY